MTTGTAAGIPAREYHTAQVHYMRKTLNASADNATQRLVGVLPAGALVLKNISGAYVRTPAFDAGTVLNIGTSTSTSKFATDLSLTLSNVFTAVLEQSLDPVQATPSTVYAQLSASGSIGSAGVVEVIIAYIADNDL